MDDLRYEATINGDKLETIDPVVRIIIDNGFQQYEFAPEDIHRIEIRALSRATLSDSRP